MKKLVALILALSILLMTTISVSAVQSGKKDIFTDNKWKYVVLDDDSVEITEYTGDSKNLEIPKKIKNHTVTSIGIAAFYNSSVEKVTFPDTVKTIGWWAFYNCEELCTVNLNEGLNTIKQGAFMNCPKLNSVYIPSTVYTIDEDVFAVNSTTTKDYKDIYSQEVISRQNYSTDYDFTITGFDGTIADKYALDNNLTFTSKDEVHFADVNVDGDINEEDIILLKKYLNDKATLSPKQKRNSDIDGDGQITSKDTDFLTKHLNGEISYYDLPATQNLKPFYSYLDGMTMYCDGDSVAQGVGTKILGEDFYSYCNYVTDEHDLETLNRAVSGTTLAKQEDKLNKDNKSILERVEEMQGNYDVVLIEGGFNDVFQSIELGEMTDINDKSGNYDEFTTAGALESICYFLNKNYTDSIKLFVICHTILDNESQNTYWNTIRQILDKWNIEYVDISTETDFSNINDEITTQYFKYKESISRGDAIHPLKYAHQKVYGPLVSEKLNELAKAKCTMNFSEKFAQISLSDKYQQLPMLKGYSLDDECKWSSDNPDIAYVNQDGEVFGRAFGRTKIRLSFNDGTQSEYNIEVKNMALDLHLNRKIVNLNEGESFMLKTSACTGAIPSKKTFKSSNDSIASVDSQTGIITAKKEGTVIISCKAVNGVKTQCKVTVNNIQSV